MKVKELQELVPLTDVYEFKKYNMYIFIIRPGGGLNPDVIPKLKEMLHRDKVKHAFIMVDGDDLKIFELKPDERGL